MTYVLMHNGRPVRTATNQRQAKRFAQDGAVTRREGRFGWTSTGKMVVVCKDGRRLFTGVEIVRVESL